MTTNGPSARLDALCSVRAASSLPAPDGPTIRMRLLALARPLDGLAQLVHAGRAADQHAGGRRQLLELLHLALQPRGLQRPRRHQDQPVGLERLFDEVVGAALDGGDRGLDVAVAGDHHHRHVGVVLLDLLEQLQAVELAALQPDVEKHQMRPPVGDLRQRRIAVARGPRGEAFVFENAGNQIANIGFVVDDQNVICHGHLSVIAFARCSCCRVSGPGFGLACCRRRLLVRLRRHGKPQPHPGAALTRLHVRGIVQLDPPPWSSRIRPTMARPRPVPFSRVVT